MVIRVGRATASLIGFAVVLALVLKVTTAVLAGTGVGSVFNLSQKNT
jgi:hypothetical protein